MLQMMKQIAARCRQVAQRHSRNAGTLQETIDPSLNGKIEIDPLGIDEERNLPDCDRTHENGAAVPPAGIDECTGGSAQPLVTAVEP